MKKLFTLSVLMMLAVISAFAQGTVKGKIVAAEDDLGLPSASVVVKGTSHGVTTDFDGNFVLPNVDAGQQTLVFTYIGYIAQEVPVTIVEGQTTDLGTITLSADVIGLREVEVLSDVAIDRKTPVAVSTISGSEIATKVGNQEFVEVLRVTPGVYATKQGGGFGDSRINIRGFDQRNTAVMINGVPVNDMENGWVYWSNWAGLNDVTSTIQVQRGLSASKLAVSSVGGSINIITDATAAKQGAEVKFGVGNDGYNKVGFAAHTGLTESGWALSLAGGRTSGDGYIDGTSFLAYNYFASVGKQAGDHLFQLTFTGAPQTHNQRLISNQGYDEFIIDGERVSGLTLNVLDKLGKRYNPVWGKLNGEEYSWRENFYHKPVAFLNHYWSISEKTELATTLYGSWGRGGGSGDVGNIRTGDGTAYATNHLIRDPETQLIDFDAIVAYNSGQSQNRFLDRDGNPLNRNTYSAGQFPNDEQYDGKYVALGSGREGYARRASMNSHNWYGVRSNFETELSENLKLITGIDLRTYKGIHYRRIVDLMGNDAYLDVAYSGGLVPRNVNNPSPFVTEENAIKPIVAMGDDTKIYYYNDGLVRWAGAFGQMEYAKDDLSAFVALSGSNQWMKRIDYFLYTPENQESEWLSQLGGSLKTGANYNIDEKNNVYFNTGYYSRQPMFDNYFLNNTNEIDSTATNEKVFGLELGYGLRGDKLSMNVNLYNTQWSDRAFTRSTRVTLNEGTPEEIEEDAQIQGRGVSQLHQGVEVEMVYRPTKKLTFNGMVSVGNWRYNKDITTRTVIQNGTLVDTQDIFLDGVKVGDAAQTTASINANYKPVKGLNLYATYVYNDNLYADFNVQQDVIFQEAGNQAVEVPSYGLLDAGLGYSFELGKLDLRWGINVNNVLNTEYISELESNFQGEGVDLKDNYGFYGFGRTWNTSLRIAFK